MKQGTFGADLEDAPTPSPTGLRVKGDPMPWPRSGQQVKPGRDPQGCRNASPRDLFKAGWVWQPWVHHFQPKEQAERAELIKIMWSAAGLPLFDGPVVLRAEFIFARPSSHFGTGKNAGTVKPQHLEARPGGRGNRNAAGQRTGGDTDNLVKLLKDALSQTAYHDDGQVCRVEAEKAYVDQAGEAEPVTIFDVQPLRPGLTAFGT